MDQWLLKDVGSVQNIRVYGRTIPFTYLVFISFIFAQTLVQLHL